MWREILSQIALGALVMLTIGGMLSFGIAALEAAPLF
jgi:hypothetical protein